MLRKVVMFVVFLFILTPLFFYSFQYFSRAASVKANIIVDINKTTGPFPDRWKALAQGGEEAGVRMLETSFPRSLDFIQNIFALIISMIFMKS